MQTETRVWSIEETVDLMREAEHADSSLKDVNASIFRIQADGCVRNGWREYWTCLEATWRERTEGAPLPSKWRSSKSVLKSALAAGLDVIGKGKTALEKEIKAHKEAAASGAGVTGPADKPKDVEYYKRKICLLYNGAVKHLESHELNELDEYMRRLAT